MAEILEVVHTARKRKPRLAEIEWKKNFPELLSPEEAEMLGITEREVREAKRLDYEIRNPVSNLVHNVGRKIQ
jgi:hypothetical protein